ncbi:MAG: hypothetical protein U0792_17505 [Gemmataceae bacterium]
MPETPEPSAPPPADAGTSPARTDGIGSDLLKSFPSLADMPTKLEIPAIPASASPPAAPAMPAVHGAHLVSPMQPGPDGYRVSSCPVCLAQAVVPQLAGGWAPLRCASCGTEFVASDGSPPPPTVTIKPVTSARAPGTDSRLLALMLLGDGGQRHAHCPACHSLEIVPALGIRVDMRCRTCGTEFTAVPTLPTRHPVAPPPPVPGSPRSAPASPPPPVHGTPVTDAVLTDLHGNKFVICPLCRKFKKQLPRVTPTFTLSVKCEGCRRTFTVNVPREMLRKPVAKVPPKSTATGKRRRWWVYLAYVFAWGVVGYVVWKLATGGWEDLLNSRLG